MEVIEITNPLGTDYTYSINGTDFQTETTFDNLAPGDYTITVMNADGCTNTNTATISPLLNVPAAPELALTQPTCIEQFGSIEITNPLGTDYTYSINGTDFQAETTFDNLAPGDYTITVMNVDGCTNTNTATISPLLNVPAAPELALTQPTCIEQFGSHRNH